MSIIMDSAVKSVLLQSTSYPFANMVFALSREVNLLVIGRVKEIMLYNEYHFVNHVDIYQCTVVKS